MSIPDTIAVAPPRSSPPLADVAAVERRLRDAGFAFVAGDALQARVAQGEGWAGFAASWDDLELDRFMADGGTYRKRRFACLAAAGDVLSVKPPQPHVQTREHNPLNGGIARSFAPVRPEIALHPVNRALVETCRRLFEAALPGGVPARGWHVEMHQFRIEARAGVSGRPTPEGLHRDGVDGVFVMMVRRENVDGGESTIAGTDRQPLAAATLAEPLEAVILDDHRVFHGVSAIHALDPARPAFRDVLVLTFRAEEG